jgi:hypothetical protein
LLELGASIIERAPLHAGARRGELLGAGIRARETDDLVARADELFDDGRTDESRRASDEHSHVTLLP